MVYNIADNVSTFAKLVKVERNAKLFGINYKLSDKL